jgi:hypothetical protein
MRKMAKEDPNPKGKIDTMRKLNKIKLSPL